MKRLSLLLIGAMFLGGFLLIQPDVRAQEEAASAPAAEAVDGVLPSLKFKEADIGIVLQAIAQKAVKNGKQVNIIIAPEVEGLVTVDLKNTYWLTALDAVLKIYDYSFEWIGEDIIMVTTLDKLAEKRQKEAAAALQEPLETISHKLSFLDARDIEKMLKPQLTARGKITVLDTEPQKGWRARGGFAAGSSSSSTSTTSQAGDFSRAEREGNAKPRTNTLVITDTKSNLRAILDAIRAIDIMPRQVLIKTKIVEVGRDKLKDIGFDYGSGATGASGTALEQGLNSKDTKSYIAQALTGTTTAYSGDGLKFNFRKYVGNEFEIIMHALENDSKTNTLSEPSIVTLDGQEAYIMVGEKTPIIESSISSSDSSVGISKKLSYYQNLGIELNVVPQICGDSFVNLIIYPSVTSSNDSVTARSIIDATSSEDEYPIIKVRETQTQILLGNKETIAIGGLLKDIKTQTVTKTPILGDIPLIGKFFQRKKNDNEKIDLLIFITVEIIDPSSKTNSVDLVKAIVGDYNRESAPCEKKIKKSKKTKCPKDTKETVAAESVPNASAQTVIDAPAPAPDPNTPVDEKAKQ